MLPGEHFIIEMQIRFLFYSSYTIIRKRILRNSNLDETSNMIPPLKPGSLPGWSFRGGTSPTRGCTQRKLQSFPDFHPKAHIFTVNSQKPKYEKSDFEMLSFELDRTCFLFEVFKHQTSWSKGSHALDSLGLLKALPGTATKIWLGKSTLEPGNFIPNTFLYAAVSRLKTSL